MNNCAIFAHQWGNCWTVNLGHSTVSPVAPNHTELYHHIMTLRPLAQRGRLMISQITHQWGESGCKPIKIIFHTSQVWARLWFDLWTSILCYKHCTTPFFPSEYVWSATIFRTCNYPSCIMPPKNIWETQVAESMLAGIHSDLYLDWIHYLPQYVALLFFARFASLDGKNVPSGFQHGLCIGNKFGIFNHVISIIVQGVSARQMLSSVWK